MALAEKKSESKSCSVVSDSLRSHRLYSPWNSPGPNTGVGSLSLLQGIFPTQVLNPGLLHYRWTVYQLSHKGSPAVKHPPANATDIRDAHFSPGLGRSPGEGNGNPFQYSCLENPIDRGAWWATVYGVAKSWTHLKAT